MAPGQLVAALVLGGLGGVSVVAVLNAQAEHLNDEEYSLTLALLFIIFIVIYRFAQLFLLKRVSRTVDEALHGMRSLIVTKVARLNLENFEMIPREDILAAMAYHYETISEFSIPMIVGMQSAVSLTMLLLYIIFISPLAVVLAMAICGFLVYAYWMKRIGMLAAREGAVTAETALLGSLGELATGFKELRLDATKRHAVLAEIVAFSQEAADQRICMTTIRSDLIVLAHSLGYLLGAAIVFVLPLMRVTPATEIPIIFTSVLFLLHPLQGAVAALRQASQVRFAAKRLRSFEMRLDAMIGPEDTTVVADPFQSLELVDVTYSHRSTNGEGGFKIGPINFKLEPGDVVFVTGGNGSGKTTTMRVLTGLYFSTGGELRLNGKVIGPGSIETYRQSFAAIFSDFHAFRRPYALPAARLPVYDAMLREMRIRHKLPEDLSSGYDPTALSTGQRKRLALALAIAEDRSVFIFDEWAADQDPQFREIFYHKIIPDLAAAGKAVLAVTHDDRYFGVASRRYHMEDGQITPVTAE